MSVFSYLPRLRNVNLTSTAGQSSLLQRLDALFTALDSALDQDVTQSGSPTFSAVTVHSQTPGADQWELMTNSTKAAAFTPTIHDAATGGNAGSADTIECEWARSGDIVRIVGRIINIDTTGMTGGNALWLRWSSGPPAFSNKEYARHFSLRTSNITVSGTAYMDPDRSDMRLEFGGFTIADINSGNGDVFFGLTYIAD